MTNLRKLINIVVICFYVLSPYINNFFSGYNTTIIATLIIIPYSILGYLILNHKSTKFYVGVIIAVYIITIYLIYLPYGGIDKFIKLLPIVLSPGVALYLYREQQIERFFETLRYCCLICIFYTFADYENLIRAMIQGSRGVYGINPLNIANISCIMLLITFWNNFNGDWKNKDLIFYIFGLVGILASGSKGPIVALVVSATLLIMPYFRVFLTFKTLLVTVSLILLSTTAINIFSDNFLIIERLVDLSSGNNSSSLSIRQHMYKWTIKEIQNQPIAIGHGINNFKENYFYGTYPHNIILELAYEVGLISSIFVFLTIFVIISLELRNKNKAIYICLFLLIVSQFSHDMTFIRNILFMLMLSSLLAKTQKT